LQSVVAIPSRSLAGISGIPVTVSLLAKMPVEQKGVSKQGKKKNIMFKNRKNCFLNSGCKMSLSQICSDNVLNVKLFPMT
jgi:hypothetical protein